ncbi:MAG: cupin domain-containing protein [Eubacteriaceae bacterium]|nr:cupin domain-containing protein [Eubacteriaceae bacterium]
MVIGHKDDLTPVLHDDGACVIGAGIKKAIGPDEGWKDYVMRFIELAPNGKSFDHVHPWPHINYYIKGQGILTIEGREYPVSEGMYTYVPEDMQHQWKNTSGENKFEFICIVPKEGHK